MGNASKEASGPKEVAINKYDYPFEYFGVQVGFAQKWSQITGEPLADTLYQRTAMHRRLFGNRYKNEKSPSWARVMERVQPLSTAVEVARLLWNEYAATPRALYSDSEDKEGDGRHFGSFAFDYQEKHQRIKVHFYGRMRGAKSDLAREYLGERRNDVSRMFTHIQQQYPQARSVIGGSWLYNLEAYRRCWPPEFTDNAPVVPREDLSLRGDSIWGQFLRADGFANQPRVRQFQEGIDQAQTVDDLYNAFPFLPLQPTVPIEIFYRYYDIKQNPDQH